MKKMSHIYIVHGMPIGSKMYDFFIRKEYIIGTYSYNRFIGEYWMSECEIVKKFLKSHGDYVYVGTSDSFNHSPKIPFKFKKYELSDIDSTKKN